MFTKAILWALLVLGVVVLLAVLDDQRVIFNPDEAITIPPIHDIRPRSLELSPEEQRRILDRAHHIHILGDHRMTRHEYERQYRSSAEKAVRRKVRSRVP